MYELLSQPKNKNSDFCSSDILPTDEITQSDDFLEEAVFAGDSFWGLEAAFGCVDGVVKTAAGYCGGTLKKPTYKQVSEGWTGHTEVVQVNYDKRKVSYKLLCKAFWESHDATNKQYLGFGVDTHYRSAIFYANEEQKKHAIQTKIEHQMKLNRRIVTKILPYSTDFFFLAENQHQKYYLQKDYIWICESLNLRSTEQFIDSSVACKLNGTVHPVKPLIRGKFSPVHARIHAINKGGPPFEFHWVLCDGWRRHAVWMCIGENRLLLIEIDLASYSSHWIQSQ